MAMVVSGPRSLGPSDEYDSGLTIEDFITWGNSLDGDWQMTAGPEGTLDEQQQEEEDLYFQRFVLTSPGGKLTVRTGSAPSDADAAIDSLTPTDIQVRVRPARNRETHKKRAEKLAKFGRGVLNEWRRKKDIFRLVASDQAIRRVAVVRVMFDDRLWPPIPSNLKSDEAKEDWEWKKRNKFPVIAEVRNPRYVRWRQMDDGGILAVMEKYLTTVAEAKITLSQYRRTAGILVGRQPYEHVWIREIWIGRYRAILIEENPILPYDFEEHGYRSPPYVIIPFRELHFENVSQRYRGMLSNAAGLYAIESQVLTMHVWQLAWNSWRTWVGHTADGRILEIIPGQFIDIDPKRDEYLQMLAGEPVPPELLQTASIIGSYIQRNGIAQGPSTQEGTRSAQQVWAIASLRQQKVEPAKQDLQRGVQQMLTLASEIIQDRLAGERLVLPVPGKDEAGDPIGEITITPSDLEGYEESFTVTFGRRLDPAVLEQAKAVMGLWSNKWMPYQVSVELGGLTDSPEEWTDMLLRESVDNLDFMKEIGGFAQIKGYYGEEDWRTQIYMQRMQTMQGGGGANPIIGEQAPGTQPTAMPAGPSPGAAAGPQPSRSNGRMGGTPPPGVRGGGMAGQTAP